MADTFKMITLVGISPESYEKAIQKAVTDASSSLRGLAWYEVQELRGKIVDGKVTEYQVKMLVAFRVEA